ncbi:MAG: hypothetical protein A2Z20_12630 [Bdellovibrionales bacterium RBG_16_40_8]|nr:MAG: hypothetical protein A2Z20_12630 [Bdellovibrionales bacterium RBG_16_40_8]
MSNDKKRKSWRTFTEDLKAIRRRPLTQAQIDDLNKTFEKDIEAENKRLNEVGKKIAIDRDSEVDV